MALQNFQRNQFLMSWLWHDMSQTLSQSPDEWGHRLDDFGEDGKALKREEAKRIQKSVKDLVLCSEVLLVIRRNFGFESQFFPPMFNWIGWTGGSQPLKKRHILTRWQRRWNMQKMEVACLQTLSHLMKDLTVLVCCHRHSVSSLCCSTHRRAGDTPRSYETLHLVCCYLLPFLKRQPKLQSQSEHESVAAPRSH